MPPIIENEDEKFDYRPPAPDPYDHRPPSQAPPTYSASSPPPSSPSGDEAGDREATYAGIPGDPEVWYNTNTGAWYAVYYAPGDFDPPIAILWRVKDDETLKAITGFDSTDTGQADKKVTNADLEATGSVLFGTTDEIPEADGDPWTGFKERMERASKTQPWLNDPEVYAIIGAAYIEGRELQEWELDDTEWSRSRNAAQKTWQKMYWSDPATAEQKLMDDQTQVRAMFETIGAAGNDPALIEFMAQQYSIGNWSDRQLAAQVEAVTSGWGEVDESLKSWLTDNDVVGVGTIDKTDEIRATFNRWLGPAYPPTDAQVREWATKLRNNASADEELTAALKAQRMSLYPEYANENLTYEDIASPWRSVVQQMWGETADETGSMFQDIVRMNDLTQAQRTLRQVGLDEGNNKVVQAAALSVNAATGGSVRRAI
jgi:hypothetical protein